MSIFTINDSKPQNKNSRKNFSLGDKNTIVFSTSRYSRAYLHPNRIQTKRSTSIHGDDRLWKNLDGIVNVARYNTSNFIYKDQSFGIESSNYILSFPPFYIRYNSK